MDKEENEMIVNPYEVEEEEYFLREGT